MTPDKLIEQAELMIRYAKSVQAGKPIDIQCRSLTVQSWETCKTTPRWLFTECEYREKPQPRELLVKFDGECAVGFRRMDHVNAKDRSEYTLMREVIE